MNAKQGVYVFGATESSTITKNSKTMITKAVLCVAFFRSSVDVPMQSICWFVYLSFSPILRSFSTVDFGRKNSIPLVITAVQCIET